MQHDRLLSMIRHWGNDDEFWGVLSARGPGGQIHQHAGGFTDADRGTAIEPQTRFACASVGKAFTAAATASVLAHRGVSPDVRLADLAPGRFPTLHPEIRVEHLLTHTSGIADYVDEAAGERLDAGRLAAALPSLRTPSDYLPLFVDRPARFEPGAAYEYCNAGYVVLGCLIEELRGRAYDQVVVSDVFERCGMTDSGFFASDDLPDRCAPGLIEGDDGGLTTNRTAIPVVGGPDGGVFVTAGDLSRFWRALTDGVIPGMEISAAHRWPRREIPDLRPRCFHGMGLYLAGDEDHPRAFCAAGSDPGVTALSALFPGSGVAVTYLSNRERSAWPLFAALVDRARRQPSAPGLDPGIVEPR